MQFRNRAVIIGLWFAGLVFALFAANKNEPYLTVLRGAGNISIVITSCVVVVVLLLRRF
jgi:beta-N-acetylhexosaminidase